MPNIEVDKTLQNIVDVLIRDTACPWHKKMFTDAINKAYQHGRASTGEPKLADNQCPGGGEYPKTGTARRIAGHPGRGCCSWCGTDFKLTWSGVVRRHRGKR